MVNRILGPRSRAGQKTSLGLATTLAALAALVLVPLALAGAISSTTNPAIDNSGGTTVLCLNGGSGANSGTGAVNCNIYTSKEYVWLSGLPDSASLGEGDYFFAVLDPGGQRDPNDGSNGNLSDPTDPYTNREFHIDGSGNLTTSPGGHDVAGNRIRVGISPAVNSGGPDWFADTSNPGGVYILAVCALPDPVTGTPGVAPHDCKYDAFKIMESPGCDPLSDPNCQPPPSPADDLVVTKNAVPSWTQDLDWSVNKQQTTSSTPIETGGSSTNVNYKVQATWSVGSNTYGLGGTIHVQNPNDFDVLGVSLVDHVLTETAGPTVDSNAGCTIQNGTYGASGSVTYGSNMTIPADTTVDFPYTCSYSGTPSGDETNRATATWDVSNGLPHLSAFGDAGFTWPSTPTSTTHGCTTVSDKWSSTNVTTQLGTVCSDGTSVAGSLYTGNSPLTNFTATYDIAPFTAANPDKTWTFTYTRAVTVVRDVCTTYNNTATVTDGDTNADNSSSASVTVCGPASGGLTMGFWQNNNGQGIIKNYCSGSGGSLGTLYAYLTGLNPFKDLTKSGCTDVAAYVTNVIKAAKCSSTDQTCNTMLKAQMLSTALDVFFSQSGWDKIFAFNGGNNVSLGGVKIDLTKICSMIDGSGGATCTGLEGATAEFNQPGGTNSCQTVSDLLSFSNNTSLSNYLWGNKLVSNSGGTSWYNQKKAYQVPAKDTFDTINNAKALTCQ